MRPSDLLCSRPQGLYCPPGDFFIDPVSPVDRALITHGHSDHARSGHRSVLATRETLDIMALRYGADFAVSRQAACSALQSNNGSFKPIHYRIERGRPGEPSEGARESVADRNALPPGA